MDSDFVLSKVVSNEEKFIFSVDAIKLFVLISHLQVAQRHTNGGSAAIARDLIEKFTNLLCEEIPEARELIELGNNSQFDITGEYFDQEF